MDIVLKSLALIGSILGAVLYFLGLGWLAAGYILHGSLIKKHREISRLQESALVMLMGIVFNYGLVLIFQELKISFLVGALLAAPGIVTYFIYLRSRQAAWQFSSGSIAKITVILAINFLLLIPLVFQPLQEWDARSFWFFNAKMIYTAGTIGLQAGWQNPAVSWANLDYPKLIPVMAAQVAYISGFWNEYLPKLAIFFVFIPGVSLLVSKIKKPVSSILVLLLIPFSFYPFIWNGYMDGLLGLLFATSLLLLVRYFQSNNSTELISSLICAAFLINLKNEGILAFISILCSVLLGWLVYKKDVKARVLLKSEWKRLTGLLIMFVPFLIWSFLKKSWHLTNWLDVSTAETFAKLSARLQDGSIRMILKYEIKYIATILVILLMTAVALSLWKIKPPRGLLLAFTGVGLYFLGITLIYFITPFDLSWHLNTSTDRTMLGVNAGIIILSFLILEKIEDHIILRSG